MPYAEVNGANLYYEVHGPSEAAPAVVLSHGGWADLSMWLDAVAALRDEFRFVVYDRRDCGRSHAPAGSDSAEVWRDDLRALLDHLGIERAVIGGQSYGALISIELLLAYPQRASAALLVGGTPDGLQMQRPGLVPFPPRRAELARVVVPALVVHGSDDPLFPLATGRELAAAIPGAEFAVIEGAGHTPNAEMPGRFAEAIAPFLRRVTGVAAKG